MQHETALGTAIHTTPLVSAIRTAVPQARIAVAGSGFGFEVWRNNPGVDLLLDAPDPRRNVRVAAQWMHKHLPQYFLRDGFATLFPQGNERTTIALAAWRAGATNRVGFTEAPQLFRQALQFDREKSQIANNLRIVTTLGHPLAVEFEPQLFFQEEDVRHIQALLQGRDPSRPLAVFVTQTSPTQRKGWRTERFVHVAAHLIREYGAQSVFVGTKQERNAVEAVRRAVQGTTWNLAGQTNLQQLAALLSLCQIGITLDTGTLHVGRAVGLPMVIIAPAWSPVVEWLPVSNPRYIILKNADLPAAPPDYIIDEVSAEEVTAAADTLIGLPARPDSGRTQGS